MPNQLRIFAAYDIEAAGMLPPGWNQELADAATALAKPAELRGGGPSSLEPAGTVIRYGLVDGETVEEALPWLARLYAELAHDLASRVYGQKMVTSDKTINGVNLNVLRGAGSRYELHVDTNPLTGLLFVTTHPTEDGGQLEFEIQPSSLSYPPRSGMLLLFDATKAPHRVTPLRREVTRISVPMNFYTEETLAHRPPGLDSYLYSED
jgi:hypothetical protein